MFVFYQIKFYFLNHILVVTITSIQEGEDKKYLQPELNPTNECR